MTYARQKYILDVEDGVFQVQRALRHTHVIGCMLSSMVVSHHSIYNKRRAVSEARASGIGHRLGFSQKAGHTISTATRTY